MWKCRRCGYRFKHPKIKLVPYEAVDEASTDRHVVVFAKPVYVCPRCGSEDIEFERPVYGTPKTTDGGLLGFRG